jgi:hypothetical protein
MLARRLFVLAFLLGLLALLYTVMSQMLTLSEGFANDTPSVDLLLSLPYAARTEISQADQGKANVTGYAKGQAFGGINVFCSRDSDLVYFMDMSGNVLHSLYNEGSPDCWFLEVVDEDAFLLLSNDRSVKLIDWDSNIRWESKGLFHHDLAVGADGEIYALTRKMVNSTKINPGKPIEDNILVVLSADDGRILKSISFAQMVSENPFLSGLVENKSGDIFHLNTVETIKQDAYSGGRLLFKRGDVLFCSRQMDIIGAIDPTIGEIVWWWGNGVLDGPHQPTIRDDGKILIFDNGRSRNISRILQLDPSTGKTAMVYGSSPPESFFSMEMGGVQSLPNGNVLITESTKGHVFEVMDDGKVVWEFWNPDVVDNKRAAIYRMLRLPWGFRNLTESKRGIPDKVVDFQKASMCDGIQGGEKQDACLSRVGVELSNLSLFDRISGQTSLDDCYGRIGKSSRNISLCAKIPVGATADSCFEFNAVLANDSGVCDLMHDRLDKGRCYWRIAGKVGNPLLCEGIDSEYDADGCYADVAKRLKNATLCDRIIDSGKRAKCLKGMPSQSP